MKRNITAALIGIVVVALASLILPASLAKRGKAEFGKAGGKKVTSRTVKTAPTAANLFLPPQASSGPISVRATNFAASIPLRDMESVHKPGLTEQQREDREAGEKNREEFRRVNPAARPDRDGALQQDSSSNVPQALPTPSLVFDGNSNSDNATLFGFRLSPPDTEGDVGPNHYVQVINLTIRIFDKAGTPLIPAKKFSDIFTALGPPCGSEDGGDPIALYDPMADRWLLSQFCFPFGDTTPPYFEEIAISQTGDPTGAYYLYNFPVSAGNNEFPDYPHLGVWPDGYYMTTNQFLNGGSFDGGGVFAFDRQKMLVGDPNAAFIYFNRNLASFPEGQAGMLPADMDGVTLPPPGTPCPFAYFTASEFGDPADGMRIFDFHADFPVPANSTFIERTESAAIPGGGIPVTAFNPLSPTGRDDVPQPAPASATTARLDAISDRLMHRLQYINFGTHESLVVTNTVNVGTDQTLANYRAGVRYYQFRKNPGVNPYTPFEQGTWAGPGGDTTTHRWMGSAAVNAAGDLAVGYSASSTTVFPSIRYAARFSTDPPGSLAQGEQEMFAGTGVQTDTGSRWGDYSSLTLDPSDDCSFWYTNETYTAASQATSAVGWITKIGKFNLGTACTPFAKGTITGTITNCQTGLPIANAFVSISGGYSRATGAAGTYSAIVTPGTYSVSATSTGYDTAMTSGLVVANGGNATFNACLNGNLKQPVADTASITADSCNSNGAIDPNETISISLGVKNTGTLDTVNLVGTLQATGGVISPSGPQTYGVVVAGGATVFKSFTFTAANLACGAPVVISLQLQDGATDLGTVTYNFTTGLQLVGLSENFDGVVAPALPAGWVAANASGAAPLWVTSTTTPDTALNDAFVDDPSTVSDKRLDTPNISITSASAQVTFRNNYTLESTFDGGVLEVSSPNINAGAFTDITNAAVGGSFVSGGYNDTISSSFSNPLAGRPAWTGSSGGYINTVANLGPNVAGQTIKLRFRMGSDTSASGAGWRIDTIVVSNGFVCCGALINSAPPPVITAESISPANNAADPEETVTVNLSLTNVGGNNTTNLVATLQPTGGVSGPSGPQTYGVVTSFGPAVTRPFTFTAQGTCGGTLTLTLALQDGATNLGTVTFNMQLGTTTPDTTSFSNITSVTIPASGTGATTGAPANPYPSNITVAALSGTVSKVTVDLKGLNHTFPDDVDVLLVAPSGEKFIIMSDVGGTNDWVNANITLDDSGAALMSDSAANGTGTYMPTNIGTGDAFPAPAPVSPYQSPATAGTATFASVFNGINPNGTWSLYVVDDANLDSGTMSGGWTINITTAQPVCNSQSCTINAPTSITIPPGTCGTIVNYSPAVTFTGACGAVVVDPPTGSFFGIGTRTVLVRGTRADASFTDASFPVTVQESETQATGLGANVTNNYCNTTVNYTAVLGAGSTTVTDAPAQTLPPPYVHCASCPELNISTTATFTAPVTTCITMPASTDFNTFSRLRILHGEPGLVNRTISGNFSTKTICARTNTVSPFVVALDANAPTAAPAFISGTVTTPDGAPLAGVTMHLSGARTAKVITDSNGNYRFNNVDTDNFYTVTPSLVNYHFGPESTSFSLNANKTDAVFSATRDAVISGNAIDTPDYFVRQHYVDFLGREPDESGFNFWSDQILSCGSDAACIERRTINVSAAYFLSIEFQETGGLVDGLYRASYNRRPLYAEFMPDTRTVAQGVIVGEGDWAGQLAANKQAFVAAWVQRPAFQSAYGGLSNASYVDTLISHTGVSFSPVERDKLVSGLDTGGSTRADVLRQIAENESFVSAKRNEAFVMMEYFGYLRRDPDESGYRFWLNKLNQFGGNFEQAEMVKAFLVSGEYRQRFRL